MSGSLAGRVALVTGASRGIGAATARTLAQAGASVALAARDEARLDYVVAEIAAAGGVARSIATDVSDPAAVERMVSRTVDELGPLDIAVNNAAGGGHPPTPLTDVAIGDFDRALAVTLRGTFLCLKHEIAAMLQAGGGSIVNMASTAGLQGVGGLAAYVASKHGIVGLTKVAALEYAAQGIRVNAIAPGPILTDQLQAAGEQAQRTVARAIPTGRIGRPQDVAEAVVWLCGEDAGFLTGATVPIDGGMLAGMAPFTLRPPVATR
ncbi:MAG: short-chain dehydrogenase/reductase [Sphingomonadales bacterium]|nr:short-chain dehydrogenase/reductase [Sphingomonadales bacterium]